MAKTHDSITPQLQDFIRAQHLFFVSTAPLDADGHVNLSPKGLDCFRVLTPHRVAYLDLTGSGNETAAHLKENGRITFMFCAFEDAPRILRLYGTGRAVLPGDAEWNDLSAPFPAYPGIRQIIVADITLVRTSCGFAVPLYDYAGERDALIRWAEQKGGENIAAYHRENNTRSLDGLPTPFSGD
jgi:hypothetical protein